MNTSIVLDVKGFMNKIEAKTGKLQWRLVQNDKGAFVIRSEIPEHISITEFRCGIITGEGYQIDIVVGKSSVFITVLQEGQVDADVIRDNLGL